LFLQAVARAKVPYTATVLVPPEDTWGPIQAIRRVHDPQVSRWMPHVTLLYPFVPERQLLAAAEALRVPCEESPPFSLTLARFGCFQHGRGCATAWLAPSPAEPVKQLQQRLREIFPWCDDTSRFPDGFMPHLSVGRWPADGVQEALAELQEGWQPLEWHVTGVSLIARPESALSSFTVRHVLPLGRAAA
jgi:2'-5' RNA ligase